MEKRKYTKIAVIEAEIEILRAEGKSRREIAEHLGLTVKQIEQWITRYNRRQRDLAQGKTPRPKGRPRKDGQPAHECESSELARLRMENRLLRDFLQFTGRGCVQK